MHASKMIDTNTNELPSYAWPGGYPIYYLCADGGVLCPDCANKDGYVGEPADGIDDPQWHVVDGSVYWEGPAMSCDGCNCDIESAYGDEEDPI
jgi:hypothetical protein